MKKLIVKVVYKILKAWRKVAYKYEFMDQVKECEILMMRIQIEWDCIK